MNQTLVMPNARTPLCMHVLRLALLSALSWTAGSAFAVDLDDLVAADMIGESIGRPLGGAIESAFELSRAGRDLTADIENARRRFWQSYPDGRVAAVSEDQVVIEYSERRVRPPGERTRTDTYPIGRRVYPEELKTIRRGSGADGLVALRPAEGTELGTQTFRFGETSIVCKEYLVKLAYSESRIWASPEIPGGVCRKMSPDGVYDNVLREYVAGGKTYIGQLPPPIAAGAKTRDRRRR